MLPMKIEVNVLRDVHFSIRPRTAVALSADEVEMMRDANLARQVRQKEHASFQNPDENEFLATVILADPRPQFLDAGLNLLLREKNPRKVVKERHLFNGPGPRARLLNPHDEKPSEARGTRYFKRMVPLPVDWN